MYKMSTFRHKPVRKQHVRAVEFTTIEAFHKQFTKVHDPISIDAARHELGQHEARRGACKNVNEVYAFELHSQALKRQLTELEERKHEFAYWFAATPLLTQYTAHAEMPVTENVFSILNQPKVETQSQALFGKYWNAVHAPDNKSKMTIAPNAMCLKCHVELTQLQHEGITLCPSCGDSEYSLIHTDRPCFKEKQQQEALSSYTYKRINHFNEWLAEFQAKESTVVPSDTLAMIHAELKKNRLTDPDLLQATDMRIILKKLKLNKFYEHIPYIMTKLTGKAAPIITKDTEEQLRNMFRQLQAPFERHCPEGRSNFLSYRYVLRKLFEILEMDDYAHQFMLPKSKQKIVEYDSVWKKICHDLGWPFFPTPAYRL